MTGTISASMKPDLHILKFKDGPLTVSVIHALIALIEEWSVPEPTIHPWHHPMKNNVVEILLN